MNNHKIFVFESSSLVFMKIIYFPSVHYSVTLIGACNVLFILFQFHSISNANIMLNSAVVIFCEVSLYSNLCCGSVPVSHLVTRQSEQQHLIDITQTLFPLPPPNAMRIINVLQTYKLNCERQNVYEKWFIFSFSIISLFS